MRLNATTVARSKPKERPYKLTDGKGLYLYVKPNGSKLWRLDYSENKVRRTISLGPLESLSLAEARDLREDLRRGLRKGDSPKLAVRRREVDERLMKGESLNEVIGEFLARREEDGLAPLTLERNAYILDRASKVLGNIPIREVRPADVLDYMKALEAAGKLEVARRTRVLLGQVFRYAITQLKTETDPTLILRGATKAPKNHPIPAITDERGFGTLLRKIECYDGTPPLINGLKLLALTFVRPSELRYATWDEFDLKGCAWNIPAERMKMRKPHSVPLSRQAMAILAEAKSSSRGSKYVLPQWSQPTKPLSKTAFNEALRRMGYPVGAVTAHGFRSSASTILNKRQFDRDLIEMQLAHVSNNVTRSIYNRYDYWAERSGLMQAWADIIDELCRS